MPTAYALRNWIFLFMGDLLIFVGSLYLSALALALAPIHAAAAAVLVFAYLVSFYIFDLYNIHNRFTAGPYLARLLIAVAVGSSLTAMLSYFNAQYQLPRTVFVLSVVINALSLYFWRIMYYSYFIPSRKTRNIVIVGAGRSGKTVYDILSKIEYNGFRIVGFLDDSPEKVSKTIGPNAVLGTSRMLTTLAKNGAVDTAVVAITKDKNAELLSSLLEAKSFGVQIYDMPSFYEELTGKLPVECLRDGWIAYAPFQGMRKGTYTLRVKKLLDIFLSLTGLLVSLPLCAVAALAIKLDSKGPVLFRQRRIGLNGRPFSLLKFRTMRVGTERDRRFAGRKDDPRITRLGMILRLLRVDEIPQMWNVLKGDMSFIGPRALIEDEVREFEQKIPYFSLRHCIRPGITGWAQVNFRHCVHVEDSLERLRYDLFYIKNLSPLLDFHILMKTVKVVLFGKGAR
ncbi:MAG: sugar transferase [Nitrospirota bacterium]